MKDIKSYLLGIAVIGSMTFTGCNTDVDPVPVNIPQATLTPNTTLLELKTQFWSDAANYIWSTPDDKEATPQSIPDKDDDGTHYIIHGRVISSDAAGNVFKSLVIQDETCALSFSINTYDLYANYRVGQEIVVDVTGMYIGKYNGLQQMGNPEWYANGSVWEASFMPLEVFRSHIELNGLPDAAKVDTIVVNNFSELQSDPEGLRKWQSQLVRFNNVSFEDGGKELFSEYQSSGVSRNLIDSDGTSLVVRTSGYCDFWNQTLPEGSGDVVGILGYYGSTGWQLSIIDEAGCMNFGNPTIAPGSENNPFTVEQAIEAEANGKKASGWITGYIVGTVAPEVNDESPISSSDDIEWTAEASLANTIVIGPDPDCTDVAKCLVMSLPQGSKLRQYAALSDNPYVYKRQIWVYGNLESYLGSWGITGNNGNIDQFRIDGITVDADPSSIFSSLNESDQQLPIGWTIDNISLGGATEIWKWEVYNDAGYLKGTSYGVSNNTESYAISPTVNLTDATAPSMSFYHAAKFQTTLKELCGVYAREVGTNEWTKLTIPTWPEAGGWTFVNSGNIDLTGFAGKKIQIAFKYAGSSAGADTWEIKNLKVLATGGGITPVTPPASGDLSITGDQITPIPGDVTIDGYTITTAKASGSTNPAQNVYNGITTIRLYANNTMTIKGSRMTKIVFTLNTDTGAKRYTTLDCSTGSIATQAAGDNTITWTGDATEVTFTVGAIATLGTENTKPGQIHFKQLDITGEGGGSTGGDDPVTPPAGGDLSITGDQITPIPGDVTIDGYTITTAKASGSTNPAQNVYNGITTIRLYANNTMTIKGSRMTKIVFTLNTDTGAKRYTTLDCSTGSIATQAAGDNTITWTGDATEVTFTVGAIATLGTENTKPGQIHFKQLDITAVN